MKIIIFFTFLITFAEVVNAQIHRFELDYFTINTFGDFAESEFDNYGAGYVSFASGGRLGYSYYPGNGFGFGIRSSMGEYFRDTTTYREDLRDYLSTSENNSFIKSGDRYHVFNLQLGMSYLVTTGGMFELEPYAYFGTGGLVNPVDEVVYYDNATSLTYSYENERLLHMGLNYTLGVKCLWIFYNNVGLSLFAEYEGYNFSEKDEYNYTYSYNTFEKRKIVRDYDISSVNIGIGISYSLGQY